MAWRGWVCGLAVGVATAALGWPALAQQATTCPPSHHPADAPFRGLSDDPARTPCAEPSLPPATPAPMASAPPSEGAPPAGVPVVADLHVASTELGFDRGTAPAPGRTVGFQGRDYVVVEVAAADNGPTFLGGSRFVITTRCGALEVGLKALDDRERQVAAASIQ